MTRKTQIYTDEKKKEKIVRGNPPLNYWIRECGHREVPPQFICMSGWRKALTCYQCHPRVIIFTWFRLVRVRVCEVKMLRRLVIACTFLFGLNPESTPAQSLENEINEENGLESLLSYADDTPELFSRLDLNQASVENLLSIPGMSSKFASSIVQYRNRVKFIRSIDELSRLEGATPALLSALDHRAQIVEEDNFHAAASSYLSYSPQKVKLYRDAYREDGIRNFQKVDIAYRNLEFCSVTDKDAGEKNYLDFCSLSASIRNISIFSVVDIGDYSISIGNGLLFSSPGNVSKSAGPISPLFSRNAYSLKPYRSRAETGYLRGAAFSIPDGDFEFTGFASSKNFNARINGSGLVTSIDYTGLHLSTSNASDEKTLGEKIVGGIVRFDSPWTACGLSASYFSYDHPFSDNFLDKQIVSDFFIRSQFDKVAFSGEVMNDKVVSFSSNVSFDYEDAQFALGLRDLRSRVVPNYSGVLSESFPTGQEQGIYFGTSIRPAEIVKMGFYYDRFKIISTSNDPDRNGEEIFVDSYIFLTRQKVLGGSSTILYLRYRYKTKEDFYVPETEFPAAQSTLAGSKQNFRIDFRHRFSPAFSIRARFEKNFLSSGESGEMSLFDAAWKSVPNGSWTVKSRICFYKTGTFNSAFYAVEDDLPGVGQYSLLYGDGARIALLVNLKVFNPFSLGVKLSRDIFSAAREVMVGSASRSLPGVTYLSMEISYSME